MMLTVLALTAACRVPTSGGFFHGLEYEDAYIYTVAGRQIIAAPLPAPFQPETPYSISTCAIGSIADCDEWEQFPEHLIGYPYLIAVASRTFGYSPSIGSQVNLVLSVWTVLLIGCITLDLTGDALAASLAGIVFAVTPVFAVYGLETSAEPASNFCITVALWQFLRFVDGQLDNVRAQLCVWAAYTATLLYASLVKREDLLLPIAAVACLPFVLRGTDSCMSKRVRIIVPLLLSSVLSACLAFSLGLWRTTATEADVLRRFPITAAHLFSFVGGFLYSFLVLHWYAGTAMLVVAGIVAAVVKVPRIRIPVSLLFAYILVYAFHVRGYYEMATGHIEINSALRFSMNLMTLWAIIAGSGGAFLVSALTSPKVFRGATVFKSCLWIGAFTVVALSIWWTVRLRNYETEDEWKTRFGPAIAAVEYAQKVKTPLYIVTMEPLTVQLLGSPGLRVVDLEAADLRTLNELVSKSRQIPLLLLKEDDRFSGIDIDRYGDPVRYILSIRYKLIARGDGYQLLMVDE